MRLNSRNWTPGSSYGNATTSYGFGIHGYEFSTQGTSMYENVTIKGKTDGVENRDGKFYDWDNALFRTAQYQTNDLSISGGDDNTKYYTSLSYTKDQSRIRINEFDRITGRINLSQKVGKLFEFGANVNIARSTQVGFNDTRNTGSNYFMQTRNLLWGFYWPTDYKTGQPFTARFGSLAQNNIFYDNEWDNSSVTKRISASPYVQFNLLPELKLKSIFSYDNSQITDHIYYSAVHYNGAGVNGSVNDMTTNENKVVSSTTLNYNKTFGDHGLGFLAGFETEKNVTDFQRATGTDLPTSTLQTVATAGIQSASSYEWGNSIVSGLARLEYNYKQKYFLSSSYRRDGSSRLHPDTRWSNFWSIGGSWLLSSEDFMKSISFVDNLRLRASYGTNGTFPTDNYAWRALIFYGSKYNTQAGGTLNSIPDKELKWEKNVATNIALEFGLLKRITGTVEFFNRDTKDLLLDVELSRVTGASSVLKNIGSINNKGVEIDLSADLLSKNNFKWSAGINASFLSSKVTKLYRPEGATTGNDFLKNDPTGGDTRALYIYREGASTLSFWGYEWAGVDPENGKPQWYTTDASGTRVKTSNYGDASKNQKVIGAYTPDFFGGFSTNLNYKNFDFAAIFSYSVGGEIYNYARAEFDSDGAYTDRNQMNLHSGWSRWEKPGDIATHPQAIYNNPSNSNKASSRFLETGTYLKMRSITLGYNMPIESLYISNLRLYIAGENLFTITHYSGVDPEIPPINGAISGVATQVYPSTRKVVLGLNLTL